VAADAVRAVARDTGAARRHACRAGPCRLVSRHLANRSGATRPRFEQRDQSINQSELNLRVFDRFYVFIQIKKLTGEGSQKYMGSLPLITGFIYLFLWFGDADATDIAPRLCLIGWLIMAGTADNDVAVKNGSLSRHTDTPRSSTMNAVGLLDFNCINIHHHHHHHYSGNSPSLPHSSPWRISNNIINNNDNDNC